MSAIATPKFLSASHLETWLRTSRAGRAAIRNIYPYQFESFSDLEKFLAGTTEGQDLLERFERRKKVLVVLYSDGWVESYSTPDVDVKIVNKPHASSAEGGYWSERYLEEMLPRPYAEIYCPGYRRAADKLRKVTAADLLSARMEKEVLRTISAMENR